MKLSFPTSTAIALRPKPMAIEFRRCMGHCCDPVTIDRSPGEIRLHALRSTHPSDVQWIMENLIYLGWKPPSRGGWPPDGCHLYRCPFFDKRERKCTVYGQGRRCRMCRDYPEYDEGMWKTCEVDGCTRRTIVIGKSTHTRWLFPDLWHYDRTKQWYLFRSNPVEAVAAPQVMADIYER